MLNENKDYDYDGEKDQYTMSSEFKDYYFFAQEEEDPWGGASLATVVVFCPIEYFEANGYLWDQYSPMEDNLPEEFSQCMEVTYEFAGTVEEAIAKCKSLGFVENQKFNDFLSQDYEDQ